MTNQLPNAVLNPEPAKLTPNEQEQIGRIMEKLNPPKEKKFTIKPPVIVNTPSSNTAESNTPVPVQEAPVEHVKRLTKEEYDAIKNAPPVEPNAELKAKLYDAYIQKLAGERAEREPLPDTVADALLVPLPDSIEVTNQDTGAKETIKVRNMRTVDITIFKLTKSPLYNLMVDDQPTDAINSLKIGEESMFDLVYQFTNDARSAYKLIQSGYEKYHDQSMELAIKYTAEDMGKVLEYVLASIGQGNSTRSQFAAPKSNSSEATPDKKKQE